jgi:hypothetical protein
MANVENTKRTPVIACETDAQGLTLSCVNGETLRVTVSDLSAAIIEQAVVHGLKQKLIDAAAISRDPETGKSATPGDKWLAVTAVYDRLLRGEWNAARGEGGGSGNGLLFRALSRLYPTKTANQLREFLDGKSAKEQAALRANPKIAAIIEEIKAEMEKAAPDTDTDSMLAELDEV